MKSISKLSKLAIVIGATLTLSACGSSEEPEAQQPVLETPEAPPVTPPPTGGGGSGDDDGSGDDSGDGDDESGDDGSAGGAGGGEDDGGEDDGGEDDGGEDDGGEDDGGEDDGGEDDGGEDDGGEDDGGEDEGGDGDDGGDGEQTQVLFDEDIAENIVQSKPSAINLPLGIQATLDVEYLGAFRPLTNDNRGSNGAIGKLGYNPDNNSIFMAGHTIETAIAEFAVPAELSLDETISNIVIAEVLQGYFNVLGQREAGIETDRINGILYHEGNLVVTSEIWYDGAGTNVDNLQVFENANDLASSPYTAMLQLDGAATSAGYMSEIPASLQESIGSSHIVGWAANYGIDSRYSQGPSLFAFNPQNAIDAEITVDRQVGAEAILVYPFEDGKKIVDSANGATMDVSPIWGTKSNAHYGFIVPDTDYFLVIGTHGGIHSGVGYKVVQDDGLDTEIECPGYCTYSSKDNYNYFWIFSISDMLAAPEPWQVQPISYGKWSHPYDESGEHEVIGGAYDIETSRLYITLSEAGQVETYANAPLILTYSVTALN